MDKVELSEGTGFLAKRPLADARGYPEYAYTIVAARNEDNG